jgi:hypothetical protein
MKLTLLLGLVPNGGTRMIQDIDEEKSNSLRNKPYKISLTDLPVNVGIIFRGPVDECQRLIDYLNSSLPTGVKITYLTSASAPLWITRRRDQDKNEVRPE